MGEPWWEAFYDDSFADLVMASGDEGAAEATAGFLIEKLALRPGDTVFDQCCGRGRLSLSLARRGLEVIGVDVIPSYIRHAAAAAETEGLACEFCVGDAFEFVPGRRCAGAYNWWTSFGYTANDARNQQMLRRAFEALRPGGRFALEYYSVPHLLREFQHCIQIRYPTAQGEAVVTRETSVNFAQGMLEQRWVHAALDDLARPRTSATKLYMPHELRSLLLGAGFTEVELYGGADGASFTLTSPRCVLVARKPGSER